MVGVLHRVALGQGFIVTQADSLRHICTRIIYDKKGRMSSKKKKAAEKGGLQSESLNLNGLRGEVIVVQTAVW